MRAGFGRDEAIATVALACDALRWADIGSESHFVALLVEAHSNTWFGIEGLKLIAKYCKVVPDGASLADLVFCAGCSRVTTLFRTELLCEGLF